MSHGGSGGGGFGHVGGMHGGHHGSIQGTNVDPNWTGTTVRSQEGDWMWRWFDRLSPGQIGGLFFLGFILWLFVVYHTSHPAGSQSKLADLKNFPSAKYENTIRAASGQQAWERDPTKLMEHPAMANLPHGSARLFSNTVPPEAPQSSVPRGSARLFSNTLQPGSQQQPARMGQFRRVTAPMAGALPVVPLVPAEDLLTQDVKRPYRTAFGKAREDILPQESVYAAPAFNLTKRQAQPPKEAEVSAENSVTAKPYGTDSDDASAMTLQMLTSRARIDTSSSLGEIADGRAGNSEISYAAKLGAAKLFASPSQSPVYPAVGMGAAYAATPSRTKPTISSDGTGGNSVFHSVTQSTPDGHMRTKLVVNR